MSRFFTSFEDAPDFAAYDRAKSLMLRAGFSVGAMQAGAPTACMFGDFKVSKWRNLRLDERHETHAVIEGSFRHGPVRIRLLPAAPDAALSRLTAALLP